MCGLFGFIGTKTTTINKLLLCQLGNDNDIRGGDSCGLFIDGKIEYGIDKLKKFKDFYKESELFSELKKARVVIGHDRKTSVGTTCLESAQPVVIRNDKNEIDFVLIHNGTISNYEKLRDKYLTDAEGYTDSQIMAYIIYFWGYDVLAEYEGTGVFVTVDYRQNKKREPIVHIFKGGSKKYASSTTIDEERPLYLLKDDNGFWFSSLKSELTTYSNVYNFSFIDLDLNTLYFIDEDGLYEVEKYNRSDKVQIKYSSTNNTFDYKYGMYERMYPYTSQDDYLDYDDYYDACSGNYSSKSKETSSTSQNAENKKGKKDEENNDNKQLSLLNTFISVPDEIDKMCTLEIIQDLKKKYEEINVIPNHLKSSRIYFDGMCYMDGDIPAEGIYKLSRTGYKLKESVNDLAVDYYAFVDGILLYHPKILSAFLVFSEYYDCYPSDVLRTLGANGNYYTVMPYYDEDTHLFTSAANKPILDYSFVMPLQDSSNYVKSFIHDGIMRTVDIKQIYNADFAKEFSNRCFSKYRSNYSKFNSKNLTTIINEIYERFNS